MASDTRGSTSLSLAVLHPVFLLTGVLHAIGGPLLPSLAATYGLNDNQSGLLLSLYFAGSALGAVLCIGRYARAMVIGFALAALCCLGADLAPWPAQLLLFALLGIGVGMPMTAVNLFAGRKFSQHRASVLVFLNFSWSVGAVVAPLLAARVLTHHTFRAVYPLLGVAAALAALACAGLHDAPSDYPAKSREVLAHSAVKMIVVFAVAASLQVGIENTAAAWFSTYMLRMTRSGIAMAATLSALYWTGFLASRAAASLILLRIKASRLLVVAIPAGFVAALLLFLSSTPSTSGVALLLLGFSLAPIYPLIVAESISHVQRIDDARWILAAAGMGGSILPWLTGWISTHSGSIRMGILTLPTALLFMGCLLPLVFRKTMPGSSQPN